MEDDAKDSLHLYNEVRRGAWRHADPETLRPEEYIYISTQDGIMICCSETTNDTEDTFQRIKRLSLDDFKYRLALLPSCIKYCLTHQDDPHLLLPSPPPLDTPSKALPLSNHAYHFLHHVLGTTERLHFLRKIVSEDLLDDQEWQSLEELVLKINRPAHTIPSAQSISLPYFSGPDFILDMRQFLISILPIVKPDDLIVGVGNTPQLPIYVLKRLCPHLSVQPLPISGWAGINKASSSSWLDNIITPHAQQHFDDYLVQNFVKRVKQPKRLVFLDIVNMGFSIEYTLSRLQDLYNSKAPQTTHTSKLDGLDQKDIPSSSMMPNYLVVSLASINVINPSPIFHGYYTSLDVSRMPAHLDGSDDVGRMMPHANMRIWDQGTPVIGEPEPGLEPVLDNLNRHFAEIKL